MQYTPDYVNCRESAKITEPNSSTYKVTESFGFDGFGNIDSDVVTGVGMPARTTKITWSTSGQFPTVIMNALNQSITLGFDPTSGLKTSQTDPNYTSSNQIQATWTYDDFGRKTQEKRIDGTYTQWAYNDCATSGGCLFGTHAVTQSYNVYAQGGALINSGATYYDTMDRPVMGTIESLSGSNRNEVRYDSLGRIEKKAMPCTYTTLSTACTYWAIYSYDVINRLTESQRPISSTNSTLQSTKYGYAGRTSTVMDALQNTTTKINLVIGNLYRSQDPKGYYQTFAYDAFGSPTSVTDSASNVLFTATYAYGLRPFQTASTDADLGARSYTYDALGELTNWSDASGQKFSQTYDALSRPNVRTEPDLTTTWTWGATAASYNIGKLQSVAASGSAGTYGESFSYDSYTRLLTDTKNLPGDATYNYQYAYNTSGLLTTLQYPASTSNYHLKLQYGYTNGILSAITDASTGTVYWTANSINPRWQVTKETLGNGVVTNRTYDAVTSWVSSIQAGVGGGSAIQNNAFGYDEMGNVQQRQDNNQGLTENFYYDADYRLDHSTLNGTANLQMTYDGGSAGPGNITARSDFAGGTTWTYDPVRKHAVTRAGLAASGGYAFTYDNNGNALTRNGYSITWSSYNYPTGVNSSGESATFQYGPDRQRWKTIYTGSIGTETTYHVGKFLEKVVNGGVTDYRHYIYAGNEQVAVYSRQSSGSNTVRYLLEDHQASFASILTGTGTLDVPESFAAFGNRRNGETWSGVPTTADETAINSVSRQGYTGQTALGVSMGLNHMNGRIQDAITGRFLSPDPNVPDAGNTQSFNRYSYVHNNPLSFTDPTGFDDDPLDAIVVEAAPIVENVGSGTVDLLGDIFSDIDHFLFGSGGPKLSPYDQQLSRAGLLNAQNLQGVPTAQQAADGAFYYALNTAGAIQGPQATAFSAGGFGLELDPNADLEEVHITANLMTTAGTGASTVAVDPNDATAGLLATGVKLEIDPLAVANYSMIGAGFGLDRVLRSANATLLGDATRALRPNQVVDISVHYEAETLKFLSEGLTQYTAAAGTAIDGYETVQATIDGNVDEAIIHGFDTALDGLTLSSPEFLPITAPTIGFLDFVVPAANVYTQQVFQHTGQIPVSPFHERRPGTH